MAKEVTGKGLLIETAFYGRIGLVESLQQLIHSNLLEEMELRYRLADPQTEVIDVRISLQCQVKDSKLILPSVSKSSLLGFFDPCLNQDKKLFIRYRYRDVVYDALFDDLDPVVLPVSAGHSSVDEDGLLDTPQR